MNKPMVNKRVSTVAVVGALLVSLCGVSPARAQDSQEIQTIRGFVQLMQDYYALIKSVHTISSNSEASAILQMFKIEEVYEERGEKAKAIDVYRQVLESSKNPTIRNAAVMMLGEALKETNRSNEALDVLRKGLLENIENSQ